MKSCFSFCIYGNDPKYYLGLQENVRLIDEFFPDFDILVYRGAKRHDDLLLDLSNHKRVQWIDTEQDGLEMHRYKPILEYDVVFVRDVDSEIHARDRWCIHDFLHAENQGVQVIRDHYWHKSRLMAGLSAFFMSRLPTEVARSVREALQRILLEQESTKYVYGLDDIQLQNHLWPCVKDHVLVYSNICVFSGEVSKRIDLKEEEDDTFCGNVVLYDNPQTKRNQFRYCDFPMLKQWLWLLEQDQPEVCVRMVQDCSSVIDEQMLDQMIETCCLLEKLNGLKLCLALFAEFATRPVTPKTKEHARSVLELARRLQYRIVGTCNVDYVPQELEMVVVYGNFPDDYLCLPQSNRKMFQHVLFFQQIPLDAFVGVHPCWNTIDCIYIMGLELENERMTDVWIQLCLMNAPLNKVREYRAKKDPTLEDVYIGVTKNHIDCLNHMLECESFQQTCMFLEDDFVFTSRFQENQAVLLDFFSRNYDYELCFLSASKMHRRLPWDDLLIQSKQICTTSSGYLVHRRYIDHVYTTVVEGYNQLLEHRSQSHLYCIDRYWAKLDKIFVFKNKLGFQKPSQSKITGNMNLMLD